MPGMMDLLSQLGGHEAMREAMRREALRAGNNFPYNKLSPGSFETFAEEMASADRLRALEALGPGATEDELRGYSRRNVEVREPERPPHSSVETQEIFPRRPNIGQQLDAIEAEFGPLMGPDRVRMAIRLRNGEPIGSVLAELKRFREDWRP